PGNYLRETLVLLRRACVQQAHDGWRAKLGHPSADQCLPQSELAMRLNGPPMPPYIGYSEYDTCKSILQGQSQVLFHKPGITRCGTPVPTPAPGDGCAARVIPAGITPTGAHARVAARLHAALGLGVQHLAEAALLQ